MMSTLYNMIKNHWFFWTDRKKGKTSPVMKYFAFTYSSLYYLTLVLCQKQFGEKYQASGGQFWKFSKFVVSLLWWKMSDFGGFLVADSKIQNRKVWGAKTKKWRKNVALFTRNRPQASHEVRCGPFFEKQMSTWKKRPHIRKTAPPPKQKSLNRKNGNFWLKLNLHTAQRTYWHRRETKTPGL